MVQLIACDIDGTLLTHGARTLPEALFPCIDALQKKGVRFCTSSGRQYNSLRGLFAPVADEILYLCENGAIVYGEGPEATAPVLSKTVMPRALCDTLIAEIVGREGCEVLVSGANMNYVMPKQVDMIDRMRNFTGNNVRAVKNAAEIKEDIIKISAFCENAALLQPFMAPTWEKHFSVAIGGFRWLDFTLADKATGMRGLCSALHIPFSEILAFGDNFNDVPLLDLVGEAYMMEQADPALLARYPRHCAEVVPVLEALLKTL